MEVLCRSLVAGLTLLLRLFAMHVLDRGAVSEKASQTPAYFCSRDMSASADEHVASASTELSVVLVALAGASVAPSSAIATGASAMEWTVHREAAPATVVQSLPQHLASPRFEVRKWTFVVQVADQ